MHLLFTVRWDSKTRWICSGLEGLDRQVSCFDLETGFIPRLTFRKDDFWQVDSMAFDHAVLDIYCPIRPRLWWQFGQVCIVLSYYQNELVERQGVMLDSPLTTLFVSGTNMDAEPWPQLSRKTLEFVLCQYSQEPNSPVKQSESSCLVPLGLGIRHGHCLLAWLKHILH
jgi:hypothetical protein